MINFILANSADVDEMPHYAAFHLGLHHLPKHLFRGFRSSMDYLINRQMYIHMGGRLDEQMDAEDLTL